MLNIYVLTLGFYFNDEDEAQSYNHLLLKQ
jgi:hypothetical protein